MNKHYRFLWFLVSLTVCLMTTAQAQVFSVTTTADAGTGSLRQAITDVTASPLPGPFTITVGVTGTISLSSALPDLVDDLSFLGPGAANLTVYRSSGSFRIFTIPNNNTVCFDGLTIANGLADYGGGINNAGQLTITNCVFLDNQATSDGGGVHNTNQLIVTNTLFTNNSSRFGGGLYNDGGSSTLTSCSLTTNQAANNGGGIYNFDHTAMLTNCSLQGNAVNNNGGGLYTSGGSSTLTSCSLTSNWAGNSGGGIHNIDHTAMLTNCSLQSNSATTVGGGIYDSMGNTTLTSCSFTSNWTGRSGGGTYNFNHTATLTNCSLQNNSAVNNGGGMVNFVGSSTLTSCSFTSNRAANGGAIYNFREHTATLTNCSLQSNSATTNGGGIVNEDRGISTLMSCSLTSNQATNGGAIYNTNIHTAPFRHRATLTNCSLQSNSAADFGGGLYNDGNISTLTNCSLQSNSATEGGGIYNNNSNPTLTNCVLFGNNGANMFGRSNGGSLSATYSLFELSALVAGVNVSGPGNLTTITNPFVSVNSTQLRAGSPAIDAGNNAAPGLAGITTDLDQNPRIVGCRVDMGASEFQINPQFPPVVTFSQLNATTLQVTGGVFYERTGVLDRINGYEIRQTDSNTSGLFTIARPGTYTFTVTGANGCQTVLTNTVP